MCAPKGSIDTCSACPRKGDRARGRSLQKQDLSACPSAQESMDMIPQGSSCHRQPEPAPPEETGVLSLAEVQFQLHQWKGAQQVQRDHKQEGLRNPQNEKAASTSQGMNPLWKTKLCTYFQSCGVCRRGDMCTFAHGEEELRQAPDFTRTSICPQLLRSGACQNIDKCPYAHTHSDLRSISGLLKTRMCDFYPRGLCAAGTSCRFAHSVEELNKAATLFSGSTCSSLALVPEASSGSSKQSVSLQNNDGGISDAESVLLACNSANADMKMPPCDAQDALSFISRTLQQNQPSSYAATLDKVGYMVAEEMQARTKRLLNDVALHGDGCSQSEVGTLPATLAAASASNNTFATPAIMVESNPTTGAGSGLQTPPDPRSNQSEQTLMPKAAPVSPEMAASSHSWCGARASVTPSSEARNELGNRIAELHRLGEELKNASVGFVHDQELRKVFTVESNLMQDADLDILARRMQAVGELLQSMGSLRAPRLQCQVTLCETSPGGEANGVHTL